MNWLLIAVILVFAIGIVHGYKTGLFMTIFSFVSWIAVFVFVVMASPRIDAYIYENTHIPQKIEERCAEEIRKTVTKEVDKSKEEFASTHEISEEGMEKLGFLVPAVIVDRVMEEHGTYDMLAERMTELAVRGLSYLSALIVALVLVEILRSLIKGMNKVPLLGKVNRKLGVLVGAVQGLLVVWVAFGLTAICIGTQWGRFMITYIYESPFLVLLYENNILLNLILYFI